MVSALAPCRVAVADMVGKSTCGEGRPTETALLPRRREFRRAGIKLAHNCSCAAGLDRVDTLWRERLAPAWKLNNTRHVATIRAVPPGNCPTKRRQGVRRGMESNQGCQSISR